MVSSPPPLLWLVVPFCQAQVWTKINAANQVSSGGRASFGVGKVQIVSAIVNGKPKIMDLNLQKLSFKNSFSDSMCICSLQRSRYGHALFLTTDLTLTQSVIFDFVATHSTLLNGVGFCSLHTACVGFDSASSSQSIARGTEL